MNRTTLPVIVCMAALVAPAQAAQDAQQIVDEAQRRTTTKSERYEGLLESFNKSGKTSEKRWIFERVGSHGESKSIIRFTAPSEVQGALCRASLRLSKFVPDEFVEPEWFRPHHALRQPQKKPLAGLFLMLAERVGFEPTVRLHARLISSQVHSTTLPPLRKWAANDTGTCTD